MAAKNGLGSNGDDDYDDDDGVCDAMLVTKFLKI